MIGYKVFDRDWKCEGIEFSLGEKKIAGCAECRNKSFQVFKDPLEILYCSPPSISRYAKVLGEGVVESTESGPVVCEEITVLKELSVLDIINEALSIEALSKVEGSKAESAGNLSVSVASGPWSSATSTGGYSVSVCNSIYSIAEVEGDLSVAVASNALSGSVAKNKNSAAVSGESSFSRTMDKSSVSAGLGFRSKATAFASYSVAAVVDKESYAYCKGQISSSVATGRESVASVSKERSVAVGLGHKSLACAESKNSIAVSLGVRSSAKGSLGSWLVLFEVDDSGNVLDGKMVLVDGQTILPDKSYTMIKGEVVELERNEG